jgi:hypothetical protein
VPSVGIVVHDKEGYYEEDNFEEITESRDIIEDRINRIKLLMIEFTTAQTDVSVKISNL